MVLVKDLGIFPSAGSSLALECGSLLVASCCLEPNKPVQVRLIDSGLNETLQVDACADENTETARH